MSSITLAVGRPTLADRIFTRTLALDIVLVVAGAALTVAEGLLAATDISGAIGTSNTHSSTDMVNSCDLKRGTPLGRV